MFDTQLRDVEEQLDINSDILIEIGRVAVRYFGWTISADKLEDELNFIFSDKTISEYVEGEKKELPFADALSELDKVLKLLEANPELHIELSAHTDDIGTDAYNDQLSTKRGESALEYLVRKGINRSRLTSVGYGKHRPLVPNDSEENRAINRRVEFKVTEFK